MLARTAAREEVQIMKQRPQKQTEPTGARDNRLYTLEVFIRS